MTTPTLPIQPTELPAYSAAPTLADPENFDARADVYTEEVVAMVPKMNAENAKVWQNARASVEHAGISVAAAGQAIDAAEDAEAARLSAATSAAGAAAAPGTSATSTTALTLAAGTKAITLQQTGKAFTLGQTLVIADRTAPDTRQMAGVISAANPAAGTLSVVVPAGSVLGSGSGSDWQISLAPPALSTPAIAAATVVAVQPGLADMVAQYAYFYGAN